jgi:hypothetical protein
MRWRSLVLGLLLSLSLAVPVQAATLLASAARTASGTSTLAPPFGGDFKAAVFLLSVTAAATDVGDTLDVYLQSSVDGGTTWDDFAHFTQVLGNGGAKKYLATWTSLVSPESELKANADAALAAGVLQGPVGSPWRVKWVIADAGTVNVSFTFSLSVSVTR